MLRDVGERIWNKGRAWHSSHFNWRVTGRQTDRRPRVSRSLACREFRCHRRYAKKALSFSLYFPASWKEGRTKGDRPHARLLAGFREDFFTLTYWQLNFAPPTILSDNISLGSKNGRPRCSEAVCVSAVRRNISPLHYRNLGKTLY